MSKGCLMKKLYSITTPYIQIGGWAVVAVPAVFSMYSLINDARAYGERIEVLEKAKDAQGAQLQTVDQKLDVIIQYTRPRR